METGNCSTDSAVPVGRKRAGRHKTDILRCIYASLFDF